MSVCHAPYESGELDSEKRALDDTDIAALDLGWSMSCNPLIQDYWGPRCCLSFKNRTTTLRTCNGTQVCWDGDLDLCPQYHPNAR